MKMIEYHVSVYDNGKYKDIIGEEETETLAIRKIWELAREYKTNAYKAYFISKNNEVIFVSTISGKVHRENHQKK